MNILRDVLINLSVTAALGGVILFFLKQKIQSYFTSGVQKELLKHKHDLDLMAEQIKSNIKDSSNRSQIYFEIAHEKYHQLYRLLLISHGNITRLLDLKMLPDFEKYNSCQIRQTVVSLELSSSEVERVVSLHEDNSSAGAKETHRVLGIMELERAKMSFYEAKNFWLENELYFTSSISNSVDGLLKNLWSEYVRAMMALVHQYNGKEQAEVGLLSKLLEEIKNKIKGEIVPSQSGL